MDPWIGRLAIKAFRPIVLVEIVQFFAFRRLFAERDAIDLAFHHFTIEELDPALRPRSHARGIRCRAGQSSPMR